MFHFEKTLSEETQEIRLFPEKEQSKTYRYVYCTYYFDKY